MKTWLTNINGFYIHAPSLALAKQRAELCHDVYIIGELIMEIPCDDHWRPIWEEAVDYTKIEQN